MESLLDFLRSLELREVIAKAKEKGDWGPVWKYLTGWVGGKSFTDKSKATVPQAGLARPAWEGKIYTDLLNAVEHASPEQKERIIEAALKRAEQQHQHEEENHQQQKSHQKQHNVRGWLGTVASIGGVLLTGTLAVLTFLKKE